jgi:hypothetical protein
MVTGMEPADGPRKKQRIKINAVRREDIDYDTIAYVLWDTAQKEIRRRKAAGEPPRVMDPKRRAQLLREMPELADIEKESKQLKERLRKLKANEDGDGPNK